MAYRNQRRITNVILLFLSFFYYTSLVSRDINLDEIYINPKSTLYTRLIQKKTSNYDILQSYTIDKNIIFSGWISPSSIVFIKEYKSINRNIIYQYNLEDTEKRKIVEINGALIYTKLSKNGHFLMCKSLTYNGNQSFTNKIYIIDLHNTKVHTKLSKTVFTDFTVSYFGDTVYYENSSGIIAYNPKTDKESLFLPKNNYSHLVSSDNVTLCYVSPKNNKILLLNGGGGSYDGVLLHQGTLSCKISGITSSREIFWINDTSLAFRSGYIGNYSVKIYNTSSRKYKTLINRSLNTNITDSSYSNFITFQQDGILHSYNIDTKLKKEFLIEGEDVMISPLGDYFTSLYNKTLYVTNLSEVRKKKLHLRRNSSNILSLYQSILNNVELQENEFSSEYISRKIAVYRSISQ